ncbi:tail fiber domain-containing protein [Candidatus Poribacteria bacterium]|nr:tail fiber domain-containing protein [Candidatus Poribacteria bacterium]
MKTLFRTNRIFVLSMICSVFLLVGFWLYQTQAQQPKPGKEREVEVEIGAKGNAESEDKDTTALQQRFWKLSGNSGTQPGTHFLGTTDSKDLVLKTNGAEALRIKTAGNVGIGTTSPAQKLDVNGSATISGTVGIGTSSPATPLHVQSASTGDATRFRLTNTGMSGRSWDIGALSNPGGFTAGSLGIADMTADAWRLLIDPSGNVGIGTTSPASLLGLAHGTRPTITFSNNGFAVPGAPLANSNGDKLLFWDASDYRAAIGINSNELWLQSGGSTGGIVSFYTRDTSAAPLERMRITSTGNVGIGTTSPTQKLEVAGNVLANAYLTPSSERWKTNIKPIENALDKVQRLRGVSYDWKADGQHNIGLIAEEVGEVIPEVVAYEANGKDAKSVDYARLVAVLIEAIKEQHTLIETQHSELAEVKAKMAQMESALQQLQAVTAAQ